MHALHTMHALRTTALISLLSAPLTAQQDDTRVSDQEHLRDNVFAQMPWNELGPVTFGGRIVDIAVHPENRHVFWIASASGGLWKTENHGVSWTAQFQDRGSISIGDMAIAPSDPDTLYVGTGEANNQRSSYWGDGVHKSVDGGRTWQHVGLEGTEHIGRIVVHPANADVVYVAALGALYSPNQKRGLYRTRDGGVSWERVHHIDENTGFVDVVLDPSTPTTLFAASYERRRRAWNFDEGGVHSRIYRSTDGGDSWTLLENGLPEGDLGRIGLAISPQDPNTLYACIENLNPAPPEPSEDPTSTDDSPRQPRDPEVSSELLADPLAREQWLQGGPTEEAQDPRRRPRGREIGGEVYRSDDRGESWRKTNDAAIGGSPGYYYGQIRIDPNDKETVYVLSVPVHKSTDGGKSWTPSGRGRGNRGSAFHGNLHVDHHALWIDPSDSRHCLLGNDGGLGITWDGGETWDHVARLPLAQFYAVGIDHRTPYTIYGGLQDNGTWGFPVQPAEQRGLMAEDAFRIGGGDGFYVVVDPENADIVYCESQFGGMTRIDRSTGARNGIKPKAAKGSQPLRFNWMTPLVLSPHAAQTIYTGSQYLHRSRNRGDDWQTISPDLTTNDPEKKKGDVPHCTITTISESPLAAGCIYVGTDDGRVWLTRNEGQRWTELTDRFGPTPKGLWVSRVETSPHAADTAFVAFTGYREDRREPLLFRTDDGGETWLEIHNDLPMEPINVVRCHPSNPRVLLVGTERSAYVSIDDGAHWFSLGGGLPRTAVHDLAVHPHEHHVIAGTHGRGIWVLDGKALADLSPESLLRPLLALAPSDGVVLPRSYSPGYSGARTWTEDAPFTTATFRFHLASDHEDKVEVEVVDVTGEPLFRQEVEAKAGYHEVAWRVQRGGRGMFGGISGMSGGRPRATGQQPGHFAVRIRLGNESQTKTFRVHDRRPNSTLEGSVQGLGATPPEEHFENGQTEGEGR
jgi:photosystem II stability/assembly factor-like uncharacterized protein